MFPPLCEYQSHAEKTSVRPCDVVVDVAAAPQQLQQPILYMLSVSRLAALDQRLATLQQSVHTGRVLAHTLLERLHTGKKYHTI